MSREFIKRLEKALEEALGAGQLYNKQVADAALEFMDQFLATHPKLARPLSPMVSYLRGQPTNPTHRGGWIAILKKLAKKTKFSDEREHFLDLAQMLEAESYQ